MSRLKHAAEGGQVVATYFIGRLFLVSDLIKRGCNSKLPPLVFGSGNVHEQILKVARDVIILFIVKGPGSSHNCGPFRDRVEHDTHVPPNLSHRVKVDLFALDESIYDAKSRAAHLFAINFVDLCHQEQSVVIVQYLFVVLTHVRQIRTPCCCGLHGI